MHGDRRGGEETRRGDDLYLFAADPPHSSPPPTENPEPRWLRGVTALLTSRPGVRSKPAAAEEREHSIGRASCAAGRRRRPELRGGTPPVRRNGREDVQQGSRCGWRR